MQPLTDKHCQPCEGTDSLNVEQTQTLLEQTPAWDVVDGKAIKREFAFPNFAAGLAFVNSIGKLAEEENHHPDIMLKFKSVAVQLSTHAVGGLSENDFIMAAKIDQL